MARAVLRVLFFGGNGHSAARHSPAQRALAASASPPFELASVPYPGFEGRPRAPSFDAFLESDIAQVQETLRSIGLIE